MAKKPTSKRGKPITLAPLSVDEASAAMLKTPPPPAADGSVRKGRMKDAQKRAKRKGR